VESNTLVSVDKLLGRPSSVPQGAVTSVSPMAGSTPGMFAIWGAAVLLVTTFGNGRDGSRTNPAVDFIKGGIYHQGDQHHGSLCTSILHNMLPCQGARHDTPV
jgi:hypothetical protein